MAREHSRTIAVVDLLARGQSTREEATRLTAGLMEVDLVWAQGPGVWSIAQCLEHLSRAAASYRPELESALAAAPPVSAPVPIRTGFLAARIIRTMAQTEPSFRMPAPDRFRPAAEPLPGSVGRFLEEHDRFLGHVRVAAQRDLNAVRVASPVSRLLKLSLGEALALLTGHAERHMAQAWRVRRDPRFPRPV